VRRLSLHLSSFLVRKAHLRHTYDTHTTHSSFRRRTAALCSPPIWRPEASTCPTSIGSSSTCTPARSSFFRTLFASFF
jgi:hypothetical protein